jgi:hypothetical protein
VVKRKGAEGGVRVPSAQTPTAVAVYVASTSRLPTSAVTWALAGTVATEGSASELAGAWEIW